MKSFASMVLVLVSVSACTKEPAPVRDPDTAATATATASATASAAAPTATMTATAIASVPTPATSSSSTTAASGKCATDADCKLRSSYCAEAPCACVASLAKDPTPTCKGTKVNCLVDPCSKKSVSCRAGACVLGGAM